MKGYHDIASDGGSEILAQVRAQQESVERSLAGVRHLLAVGSGKGGVGKSTLTMQLACALRERGHAVSILDADLNGPCQARLGSLAPGILLPGAGGAAVPATGSGIGVVSLGALFPEPRAVEFASVAPDAAHTWRATREFTVLRELLAGMDWGRLDFLLIDLPPGAERMAQYAELLGPAALFVLVTVPSDLARGVVARSLDALAKTPNRILGYVENMQGYTCPDCGSRRALFPGRSRVALELPRLGSVPFDPELAALCDRGGTAGDGVAESARRSLRRIAEEICRRVDGDTERAPAHQETA